MEAMSSARWFFLIMLLAFVGISWGVRVLLSRRVTDRVTDREKDEER